MDRHDGVHDCWLQKGIGDALLERAHVPQAYRPSAVPPPGPPGEGLERSLAKSSCRIAAGLARRRRRLTLAGVAAMVATATPTSFHL